MMFPFKNQEMISDKDLEQNGFSFNNTSLYSMPEDLIYKSFKSKQNTMPFEINQESRSNSN